MSAWEERHVLVEATTTMLSGFFLEVDCLILSSVFFYFVFVLWFVVTLLACNDWFVFLVIVGVSGVVLSFFGVYNWYNWSWFIVACY